MHIQGWIQGGGTPVHNTSSYLCKNRGVHPLFLQKQGVWLCVGTQVPPPFLLKKCLHPHWKFLDMHIVSTHSVRVALRVVINKSDWFTQRHTHLLQDSIWYPDMALLMHHRLQMHTRTYLLTLKLARGPGLIPILHRHATHTLFLHPPFLPSLGRNYPLSHLPHNHSGPVRVNENTNYIWSKISASGVAIPISLCYILHVIHLRGHNWMLLAHRP